MFIGKTLALRQTEINRSGDFCPPEADSLDVVPDENSLLGGEQAWTPPRAEAPPDVPFLCHRCPYCPSARLSVLLKG